MDNLPNKWLEIESDQVYFTSKGKLVSFGKNQIELGQKYDPNNKHLKAIEKGEVSPRGNIGLVPSQEEGYHLKSKVLGKGGNYRFHGKYISQSITIDNQENFYMLLHFPGLMTDH